MRFTGVILAVLSGDLTGDIFAVKIGGMNGGKHLFELILAHI